MSKLQSTYRKAKERLGSSARINKRKLSAIAIMENDYGMGVSRETIVLNLTVPRNMSVVSIKQKLRTRLKTDSRYCDLKLFDLTILDDGPVDIELFDDPKGCDGE
ncbi:hypothetical protein E6Q11_05085 [Candidatus Dojkabacteria bacterium]|uniref:Uncharacterized protein n=1 Tax=Candidatus Dojkabacteria bacterium TaxID=2099670 RepID=A0A5C7J6P0_9BACT|nr:MAG: hypothetical protein E6Q11_05085 [Candidatus Dojkabacteria bacterium]